IFLKGRAVPYLFPKYSHVFPIAVPLGDLALFKQFIKMIVVFKYPYNPVVYKLEVRIFIFTGSQVFSLGFLKISFSICFDLYYQFKLKQEQIVHLLHTFQQKFLFSRKILILTLRSEEHTSELQSRE